MSARISVDEIQWTQDKIDWLKIASQTPDEKGKLLGDTRLAEMASEQFGVQFTRHTVRHAIRRFIEGNEEPTKQDGIESKPPEVALLLRRIDSLSTEVQREKNKNIVIIEAIRSTVSSLAPVTPLPVPRVGSDDPHEAMLDLSDTHLGEDVDPVLTGGLSEYNFSIFKERGEKLRRGVHKILGIHRKAYPVRTLYINLLGDIVTGERVYRGQAFAIDMPLLRQIFEGGYYLASLIQDFSRLVDEVHIRAVPGNHGGDRDGHPRTNWDIAVYELLKILLKDQQNIDIEVSETSWLAYHIPGHERFRHVIEHGDAVRGWSSIPFYGFEREGTGLQSMLGMQFSYLHAGHIHNKADWDVNRLNILTNGSWVGGSDLSINRMRRLALPTQSLFFCHPRRGIAATYRVQLENWLDLEADERGIYKPVTN